MNPKLESLIKDTEFFKKILNMETKEEIIKSFAEKGIAITDEELNTIKYAVNESAKRGKAIEEDDLEEVIGGAKTRGNSPDEPMDPMAPPSPKDPQSPTTKENKPTTGKQGNNGMPALGLLGIGGAITAIGLAVGCVAAYTKGKKGSWFSKV